MGDFAISRKAKFFDGCKKGIPITFGYVPMGIGYAAIAMKAGFTPLQTISMSFLVYAGAGQIIAASMALSGATLMAIILTNFVVNLRYFVMSTCVLNKIEDSNIPLNILAAHVTVDESFAMFSLSEDSSIWIYLGIAITAWLSWCLGAAIGVFTLNLLPVIVPANCSFGFNNCCIKHYFKPIFRKLVLDCVHSCRGWNWNVYC